MVVTCSQMKEAESALFAQGFGAEPLMEEAGFGCAQAIRQLFPVAGRAILFAGKGHNAGDAYVIGRHLQAAGWSVSERLAHPAAELAPLTAQKRREFLEAPSAAAGLRLPTAPLIALDGLLGIGATGPLRESFAALAREMNLLRSNSGARVIAIDIPSGVDGDTGVAYPGAVTADVTLTIGWVKQGLLADSALDHVGRLALVPLPRIPVPAGNADVITLHASGLASLLSPPPFSRHKNAAGQVGIIAGSAAYPGAAVLAGLGALRAGGGMLHLFCPREALDAVIPRCPPEVIVHPFLRLDEVREMSLDAIGIGPGLTGIADEELLAFLETAPQPLVIDAEGLNTLARQRALSRLAKAPSARLLTPHPGEMRRLAPEISERASRLEVARDFVLANPETTLLFKGSRTIIAAPGRPLACNTTGHPGMASGGMGDVLTGMLTALLARGIPSYEAACLGSWLLGYAAELFCQGTARAPEGVTASDVALQLPAAMASLRGGAY